ncbi:MAG: NAD-dependent epimerase/dehydratase family protein, partial [Chloroflexi bacterium]|nr:NAD-dependent epimerase/dehydratase family protein [Chloroflexota bacterium]
MTTLVTGAGLIGTAFAQEAAKRGETVVFFDARPDAAYLRVKLGDAVPEVVQGDVRDLPALVDAVRTHGIDTLVHTAG